MTLDEYLGGSLQAHHRVVRGPDGDWLRRASYPELPGCDVEGLWAVDIVEELENLRVQIIMDRFRNSDFIPVPRPPLKSHPPVLDRTRLEFAKWLVEHGRLTER